MTEIDNETVEYIWRNYSYYIDLESDYLKILRAKTIPLNENDPFKAVVARYKEEPPETLQEKIFELSVVKRKDIAETVLAKYKDIIVLNRCGNCHKLKTEKSKHCIHCGNTWRNKPTI